jgi:hypothetical protein
MKYETAGYGATAAHPQMRAVERRLVAPDTNGVLLAASLFDKIRIAENLVLDAPGLAIVAISARDCLRA